MIGVAMAIPFVGIALCMIAMAVGLCVTRNWPER